MKTKMIAVLMVCASLLMATMAKAQAPDWEEKPVIHTIPDSLEGESVVFISTDLKLELKTDRYDNAVFHRTVHRLVKVIDDRGIESFNTIVLSAARNGEMIAIKARTITPSGKVIEVEESSVKQSTAENGETQYSIAFEGVEKNAELELLYVERRPFSSFGTEYVSFGLPVLTASFSFESPKDVVYRFKGYNGFPTPSSLTIGEETYYRSSAQNIPATDEEQYSNLEQNLMRVDYRLESLKQKPGPLFGWDVLAKEINALYNSSSDKEVREVGKFLKANGFDPDAKEEEKIIRIESIIKTKIGYNEDLRDDKYETIEYILGKSTTNEDGIIKLFAAAFKYAGVQSEVGITSNYYTHPVDRDFPNWGSLEIYLFHFPQTRKYLAPSFMTLRYPVLPLAAFRNTGIFVTDAGGKEKKAAFHDITLSNEKDNDNVYQTSISFDPQTLTPTLESTTSFFGYSAFRMRELFEYVDKDKEKELVQSLVYNAEKPENIISYQILNKGLEHYTDNKPLEIRSEVQAEQLLEKAGKKLLFKVGDVIGPQTEMYEDKKRVLPISMDYPHALKRNISIMIPEGYKIKNPEAVRMDIRDDKNKIGFVSDFKMNGNNMVIDIEEYYYKTDIPAVDINQFRSVINAAADFNKVTLVMEKEN